jgi:hypothetical protein
VHRPDKKVVGVFIAFLLRRFNLTKSNIIIGELSFSVALYVFVRF